jgi:cysteine-rich repeat protein
LDSGEECDNGSANSDHEQGACRTNCKLPSCGDGVKDPGEECDEGSANSDSRPDACRTSCKLASCGDGVKDSAETCDNGTANSDTVPGACRTNCALATCGDGVVDEGEQCDRGQQNSDSAPNACRTTCVSAFCGDQVVDSGETCDQGQANSDTAADACRTTCVPATCGDGVRDSNEACDNGTQNSNTNPNACRTTCTLSTCGDGVVDTGETCDDGTLNSDSNPNACRTNCLPASCGDGVVDNGEACDQGAANSDVVPDACRADCTAPRCGDSVVDGNEGCDDGNASATDGCTEICAVEDGYACPTPGQDCRPIVCGDGFTDAPETCDDGNTAGADGCSATCAAEPAGWTCTYPFDLNAAVQADGTFVWNGDTTNLGSELDLSCAHSGMNPDGIARFVAPANGRYAISLEGDFDTALAVWDGVCPALLVDELGCADDGGPGDTEKLALQLEQGGVIFVAVDGYGSSGTSRGPFVLKVSPISCGDGVLAGAEQCDDGNITHGDGCSSICTVEAGWACPTDGQPCHQIVCGDSVVDDPETCDDADAEAGDGCSASCRIESGWICPTAGQPCHQIVCGDSVVDAPEDCDDGDYEAGDGCSASCRIESGWVCPTAGQPCHQLVCGDGVVDAPETCDDGGTVPLDGCDDDCLVEPGFGCPVPGQQCEPLCGNGVWDAGEGCDDGGTAGGDGCSASCTVEPGFGCADGTQCHPISCGDGFVDVPEGCDDGNNFDDDGCSATCALEIADPLASVTYSGSLDSTDRTWTRVGEGCGSSSSSTGRYVDWFRIVNAGPAAQTITVTAAWSGDGILYLYNPPFDPAASTTNCVVGDDDYDGTGGSQIASRVLMPGQEMVVVASSYDADAIGPYSIEIATAQAPVCGDGTAEAPETCDDGGNADGDGCSSGCQIEAGYICDGITPCHQPSCGDGIVDAPELCDDHGNEDGDGCAAYCVMEIAQPSGSISLTGSFEAADLRWTRPGANSTTGVCTASTTNTNRLVDGLTIVNHTGADQRIDLRAAFTGSGYLFVYSPTFDPASQMAGCLSAKMGGMDGVAAISNFLIAADQTVVVVASSDRAGSSTADLGPYTIVVKTRQPTPVCGNGLVDGAESCDDHNTSDGDGCSANCLVEAGFVCTGGTHCHNLTCGDGYRDSPEGCDDGNTVDGDGCSSTCALEIPAQRASVRVNGSLDATDPTWTRPSASCASSTSTGRFLDYYTIVNATGAAQSITLVADWLGDGYLYVFGLPFDPVSPTTGCVVGSSGKISTLSNRLIQPGEQLMVVASTNSAGPTGAYTLDISTVGTVACGNGLLEGAEKCDDGNANAGDGCSDTCTLEPGFSCETAGQACGAPVCGDGVVSSGESCEDGNQADTDGCSATCLVEIPAPGSDRTIYGSLDATDSKWNRPGSRCSTSSDYKDRYFDAIPIVNDTGAAQVINVSAYFPSSGFLFVYPRAFSSLDRTSCQLAAGFYSPALLTSIALAAGEAITLVVSADYGNDAQGAYAVKITTVRPQACGDGVISGAEACDDHNTDAGDGCSDSCAIEAGFACPLPASRVTRSSAATESSNSPSPAKTATRPAATAARAPACWRSPRRRQASGAPARSIPATGSGIVLLRAAPTAPARRAVPTAIVTGRRSRW